MVIALVVFGAGRVAAAPGGNPFDAVLERLGVIDAKVTSLEVAVAVDTGYCGVGGFVIVTCGGVNPQPGPAAFKNTNIVRLVMLVTRNGEPVSGLGAGNIEFEGTFVPFEGANDTFVVVCRPSIAECEDAPEFQREGAGSYSIFLAPGPEDGGWQVEGVYFGEVTVTDFDGNVGTALVEFEVQD